MTNGPTPKSMCSALTNIVASPTQSQTASASLRRVRCPKGHRASPWMSEKGTACGERTVLVAGAAPMTASGSLIRRVKSAAGAHQRHPSACDCRDPARQRRRRPDRTATAQTPSPHGAPLIPNMGSVHFHAWSDRGRNRPPTSDRERANPAGHTGRATSTGHCLDVAIRASASNLRWILGPAAYRPL